MKMPFAEIGEAGWGTPLGRGKSWERTLNKVGYRSGYSQILEACERIMYNHYIWELVYSCVLFL